MKLILLAMFIFMSSSSASVVNCDDFFCDGENINFDTITKTLDINLTEDTTKTINNISTGEPLDLIIESNDSSGENQFNSLELNVNGTTNNANFSSAYHVLLSEIMGDINAVFNGRSGAQGKNSSQICAENFVAGMFGQDAKDLFEDRRISNNSLSSNVCTSEDILFLESRFSCDEGETFSNSADIEVARTAERRMCSGTFRRAVYLKRRATLNCRTLIAGDTCCTSQKSNFTATDADHIMPLDEWACDESLCQAIDGKTYSGSYLETSVDLWEHELQLGDEDNQCQAIFENTYNTSVPVALSFQAPELDENSILEMRDALSTISRDDTNFLLPQMNVSDSTSFIIGIQSSTVEIADSLGLNGSAPDDFLCRKTEKGDQGSITLYAVNEAGVKSNPLTINIQESRRAVNRTYSVEYRVITGVGFAGTLTSKKVDIAGCKEWRNGFGAKAQAFTDSRNYIDDLARQTPPATEAVACIPPTHRRIC